MVVEPPGPQQVRVVFYFVSLAHSLSVLAPLVSPLVFEACQLDLSLPEHIVIGFLQI